MRKIRSRGQLDRSPRGWSSTTLGRIGRLIKGRGISRSDLSEEGVPCIRYGEIYTIYGDVAHQLHSRISLDYATNAIPLLTSDIVFAASGEKVEEIGKAVAYVGPEPAYVGSDTIVLRGHGQESGFLSHQLNSDMVVRQKARLAKGHSVVHIHAPDLADLEILLPSIDEQCKIAEVLQTWDDALETLSKLRAAKARRLDGFVAKLIHNEQAERLRLGNFLREVSARNHGQKINRVLSVTNSRGFVLAEDQFAHRVASADLSNYKIVRRSQYAYNPSRINVGSIARLDAWENGALSPMYVVFQVRDGLNSDFFGHWLRSNEARKRIALAAQGSVRETVNFSELGSVLIPVPAIERQKSIAQTLNNGRHEIALLDAEIQALTCQKRGLMQKLLTGEWSVNQEPPLV